MNKPIKNKLPYKLPSILRLGKAEEVTHGDGKNWTDYLGNTDTRYGTDVYNPPKPA